MKDNPEKKAKKEVFVGRPVLKKLAKVMAAVTPVVKAGENKFQKYKYATEADVVSTVREQLVEQGLVVIPSCFGATIKDADRTSGGSQQYLTSIEVTYTIYDSETGDSVQCEFPGQGIDTGDKGIYKAMTGANKYFLLKTFQIPTTDDPEGDPKTDENNPPPEPEINWFPRKPGAGKWLCTSCGNRHIEEGDIVGRVGEKKWATKACYEHLKDVEGASTPEEKSQDEKLRATLEQMDRDQLEEQAYMLADSKQNLHIGLNSLEKMSAAEIVNFIMENRK